MLLGVVEVMGSGIRTSTDVVGRVDVQLVYQLGEDLHNKSVGQPEGFSEGKQDKARRKGLFHNLEGVEGRVGPLVFIRRSHQEIRYSNLMGWQCSAQE